jgi:PhnB protein
VTQQSASVKGSVIPFLLIDGAIEASKFYERALSAKVAHIFPPDETGRTMHVHLHINGASLMFSDPYPEHGATHSMPTGFILILRVPDADVAFDQAVTMGCRECIPPADMVWGDRIAQVQDPYGVIWSFVGPQHQLNTFYTTSVEPPTLGASR